MAKRNEYEVLQPIPYAEALQVVGAKTGIVVEALMLVVDQILIEDAYAAEKYKYQNYDLGMHRGKVRGMRFVLEKAGAKYPEIRRDIDILLLSRTYAAGGAS